MLNIIWPVFIVISYIYAIINNNIEEVNNSVFKSADQSVSLILTFLATICLWNGIMMIVQKTSLINKLVKLINPLINFLFPECKENEKVKQDISMNMIANFLGLGNAATPLGIKAMKSMQDENENKDTISNSMAMFIVINTASIQLIPTTVIAIRNSLNSQNPTQILFPIWIVSIAAFSSSVIATKLFIKFIKVRKDKR